MMGNRLATFIPEAGLITNDEFISRIVATKLPKVTNNKNVSYYNVPAAFDIEVSSFYQFGEKKASMYVWQFGILNWVTIGRTWDEYAEFLGKLRSVLDLGETNILPVYVHNLAYEFQFIRKRFSWDKLFFLEERKPVYARSEGVEYRCSLKLSSKSLAKVGEDLQKYKVEKMVGDLDYSLVRTTTTPLTDKELGYCENDIRVVLAYIQEKIETDGDVTKIPLTNTGYVRNFCRKSCFKKYTKYRGLMSELVITPDEYSQLKRGFQGGFTHANAHYSGKVMKNVASFDFTSSYPAVMLAEKFPMSEGRLIESLDLSKLQYYLKSFCCLMDVTFYGVVPKVNYDHPISISKCRNVIGPVTDNGRIFSAEQLTTTCTEQDFFTYAAFYSWDTMDIHAFRVYDKAYLPKPFVESIIKMYKDKTKLKDVEGEEVNYMISKNMLNSSYGMTVTDIVRGEIGYENDEYSLTKPDLEAAIKKYNEGKRRFLFYPWGVWVTAYARANLFSGILACGDDYIYSDTDSIKVLNWENHMDYINAYNDKIHAKLESAAKFHNLCMDDFAPTNKKGESKPIGVWDFEGVYDRFKTIGAKRYLTQKEGKYSLTVAGVNKKKAKDYIVSNWEDPFDALGDHLKIPSEYSGRLTLTYFDEACDGIVVDYLGNSGEYHELSYIHMEPSDYELTLSDDYKKFLNALYDIREDSW